MYKDTILRKPLESGTIRSLSTLESYKSIFILGFEWFIIFTAIGLGNYFPYPAVYVLVWLFIGSRMYALYSLLHDGLHYLLFPTRAINDRMCKLFLAWPLFIPFEKMRKAHLAHHKYLKTADDPEAIHLTYPEFSFPQSKNRLLFTFIKDITGVNFIFYKAKKIYLLIKPGKTTGDHGSPLSYSPAWIYPAVYYLVVFSLIVYMGWTVDLLLYWFIPYATIYQVLNRIRLSVEHFNLGDEEKFQTRTMKLNGFERFFMSPHNLGYHTEHHLYPSVPFYRLTDLHALLMRDDEYRNTVSIQKSYFDLLKKYIAK